MPSRIIVKSTSLIWSFGLILLLCAFLNVGMANDAPPEKDTFTFITYEAAPWQTTEPDGSVTGMVPFILKNMGDLTGYNIKSRAYPYARMPLQIKRGHADLVVSMKGITVEKYAIPCVNFGLFSNVFYTLDTPFLEIAKQNKKRKLNIGILIDSSASLNKLIPKDITQHWRIKEYTSEAAIFNAVNKKRLDSGLLSVNSYQYLSDQVGGVDNPSGVTTESGYTNIIGWLPKKFANSKRHLKMCDALNKVSSNGRMNLDSDEIIDVLITQENPDISKTPRLTPKDIEAKNLAPKLRAIYN